MDELYLIQVASDGRDSKSARKRKETAASWDAKIYSGGVEGAFLWPVSAIPIPRLPSYILGVDSFSGEEPVRTIRSQTQMSLGRFVFAPNQIQTTVRPEKFELPTLWFNFY